MRALTFVAALPPPCFLARPTLSLARDPRPPAVDLTRAAQLDSVTLAPDGKHIAALSSPDGEVVDLVIWDTANLGAAPIRVRAKLMRFLSVSFLKNDRLLVTAVQPLIIQGTPAHIIKQYVTDLAGKSFDPLLSEHSMTYGMADDYNPLTGADIVSTLPNDPRNVLVEDNRLDTRGDIYKVDVYSMSSGRVLKGSEKYDSYQVDLSGELRARQYVDFKDGAIYLAQQYRNPATGEWIDLFKSFAKDRIITQIVGFTADPNVILISTPQGGDKTGIYEYDVKQQKILEPAFEHRLFEAVENRPGFGLPAQWVLSSTAKADFGRPLGFYYGAEKQQVYWLDDRLGELQKSVNAALGVSSTPVSWVDPATGLKATIPVESASAADLVGRSDDFQNVLVEKSGPQQPPEYYLLHGGKLQLLGKSRPWIDTASLGPTTMVEYPARDGLMIPAFLTLPPANFGPGPFPTLIEPHGGPWGRDEMDWDISGWTQYFASRGYAVLRPQFRGSEGWGQKLWRAGDREWGQKMQDDNDDSVKWLADQHITDPKRVAIFGYSYGGYAALAASVRPNGPFQCAISGAGAGDLTRFVDAIHG